MICMHIAPQKWKLAMWCASSDYFNTVELSLLVIHNFGLSSRAASISREGQRQARAPHID